MSIVDDNTLLLTLSNYFLQHSAFIFTPVSFRFWFLEKVTIYRRCLLFWGLGLTEKLLPISVQFRVESSKSGRFRCRHRRNGPTWSGPVERFHSFRLGHSRERWHRQTILRFRRRKTWKKNERINEISTQLKKPINIEQSINQINNKSIDQSNILMNSWKNQSIGDLKTNLLKQML